MRGMGGPGADRPARSWWRRWRRAEVSVALLAAAGSLTPSLLPRSVLVQGLVTGFSAATGYALGALAAAALSLVRRRVPLPVRDGSQWALLAVAVVALVAAVVGDHPERRALSASVGLPEPSVFDVLLSLALAALVAGALVGVAVAFVAVVRWVARRLTQLLPRVLAVAVAALLVTGVALVLADRVVRGWVFDRVDSSLRTANVESAPELPPPDQPERSGGPGSLVGWDTLGRAGREFVSLPADGLSTPPVRVYAGILSAPDLRERAALVVAELERTGAFDRGVLCLVIPTGSGGINGQAVTALERLWDGDTAVASMQYSYLPSALAFASDRPRIGQAAEALVEAVVARMRELPEEERPLLLLYGESLGSAGAEAALWLVPGAWEVVDGVLLVGPPNANPAWSSLVASRDPGSPLLAPVVDGGRWVRFWPGPEMPQEAGRVDEPWPRPDGPRLLYLQHPSDPVVWWSPSLIWSRPAWVDEHAQLTTNPPLRWWPVVTFWQVTGDLLFAKDVPAGHGHRYRAEDLSAAWRALAPPP